MLNTIRRELREAAHWPRRLYALRRAYQLQHHRDPRVAAAGHAVVQTIRPSRRRRSVTASIERRRRALAGSDATIEFVDYGAGSSRSQRTDQQMSAGVTSTASLATITSYSKSKFWATFLFEFVRELRPSTGVELGTCVGISAAYQAAAMRDIGIGRLISLEGAPALAQLSAQTVESQGLENVEIVTGPFHETLRPTLAKVQPVDYFFNDGHHDEHAVTSYFDEALPYLSDDAVIVLDDIAWSAGMKRAWDQIARRDDVAFALDLGTIGIVFLGHRDGTDGACRLPL